MEFLQTVTAYVTAHGAEFAGLAAAFIIFFDRLSKLTPTNSDNAVVEALQKVFAFFGVRVTDNLGAK